jgi:hypothetical protein
MHILCMTSFYFFRSFTNVRLLCFVSHSNDMTHVKVVRQRTFRRRLYNKLYFLRRLYNILYFLDVYILCFIYLDVCVIYFISLDEFGRERFVQRGAILLSPQCGDTTSCIMHLVSERRLSLIFKTYIMLDNVLYFLSRLYIMLYFLDVCIIYFISLDVCIIYFICLDVGIIVHDTRCCITTHTVVIKEWRDVARDVLCRTTLT